MMKLKNMNDIVFIADFFSDEISGGGELNNEELIKLLTEDGHRVYRLKSSNTTPRLLEEFFSSNRATNFIISNFVHLSEDCKRFFDTPSMKNGKVRYIIYEHDHKYLRSRNPAHYEDYVAPKEQIINYGFYKEAIAVLCQSDFHADIVKKNLKFDNITSLGGNLWEDEMLDFMLSVSEQEKTSKMAIMDSNISHKNTPQAIAYCTAKKIDYELIKPAPFKEFLTNLGKHKTLVFFPQTPETLSRIVTEARMMGMSVITNKNVGATKESWFKLKGEKLVDIMRDKKKEIPNLIIKAFNAESL